MEEFVVREKDFKLRAKYHFLTWSNLTLPVNYVERTAHIKLCEDLWTIFTSRDTEIFPEFVITCSEFHKSGSEHCHAILVFPAAKQIQINQVSFMGQRPQMQKVISLEKAIAYIKKEKHFSTTGLEPTNYGKYRGASQTKKLLPSSVEDIPEDIRRNRIDNAKFMARPTLELLKEGTISFNNFQRVEKNFSQYLYSIPPTEYKRPLEVFWIYGPTGIGKSNFVRSASGPQEIYLKQTNKWWDNYGKQPVVLMEEFENKELLSYMKIWTDVYNFTGETKGGSVNPSFYHTMYITSNYMPQELWGSNTYGQKEGEKESLKAMFRRIQVVTVVGQEHLAPFELSDPPVTYIAKTQEELAKYRGTNCWLQYKPDKIMSARFTIPKPFPLD